MDQQDEDRLDVVGSIADYARFLARVKRAGSLEIEFERSAVAPEAYAQARAWQARMADEAAKGHLALAESFAAAFRAESALEPEAPPIELAPSSAPLSARSALGASNRAAENPRRFEFTPSSSRSRQEADPLDATVEGSVAPFRSALPFDENAEPALASSMAPAPRAVDDDEALDSTRSIEVPLRAVAPLPFGTPAPALPLERYASLTAALRAFPEKRALALGRYGVESEAKLAALKAAFERVFSTDAAAKASFDHRVEELVARLVEPKE